MDPLTAFGLSANVVQVISTSINLVSRGYQIYKSTEGTLAEFADAERLTLDLQSCNTILTQYLYRCDTGTFTQFQNVSSITLVANVSDVEKPKPTGGLLNEEEQALKNLCEDSNKIAETLLRKLNKLKIQPGSGRREWRAATQAFRAVWDKPEIDAMNTRLNHYREQLNTRILISVREQLEKSTARTDSRFETLELDAKRIIDTLIANRDGISTDVELHSNRLSRLIIGENEKTRDMLKEIISMQRSPASPPLGLEYQQSLEPNWTPIPRTPSPGPVSLHDATRSGTMQHIRSILRNSRINVDELDELGRSALHIACINGRLDVSKYLLMKGANVNIDDDTGSTPLHYAVKSGQVNLVRFLLANRAYKDIEDDQGHSPSFYGKSNFIMNWMFKFGSDLDAVEPTTGNTVLLHVTTVGDLELVRLLVEQGANVDAFNLLRYTPLHKACELGHLECIDILISAGANLESILNPLNVLTDANPFSKLEWLRISASDEILELIVPLMKNMDFGDITLVPPSPNAVGIFRQWSSLSHLNLHFQADMDYTLRGQDLILLAHGCPQLRTLKMPYMDPWEPERDPLIGVDINDETIITMASCLPKLSCFSLIITPFSVLSHLSVIALGQYCKELANCTISATVDLTDIASSCTEAFFPKLSFLTVCSNQTPADHYQPHEVANRLVAILPSIVSISIHRWSDSDIALSKAFRELLGQDVVSEGHSPFGSFTIYTDDEE